MQYKTTYPTAATAASAMHESLSLTRFDTSTRPVVQAMLPFWMPRRGW